MNQRTAVGQIFRLASQISKRSENQRRELEIQKQQCKLLSDISNFIDQAAKREAKVVYVGGMGFGIIALALLLGLTSIVSSISDGKTGGVNLSVLLGCAIAGAFGAIVSVLTQIRRIEVNAEVGRGYVRLLGGMRPFIGAIFGAVLYIALDSGLVAAAKPPTDAAKHFLFFLTFAFIAGFSERFARDTLTSIGAGPVGCRNSATGLDLGLLCGSPVFVDEAAEGVSALDPLLGEVGDGFVGPWRVELAAAIGLSSIVVPAYSAGTDRRWRSLRISIRSVTSVRQVSRNHSA